MRIAICLSGHVRDYKNYSKLLFKRIINTNSEHEFDFFLATWENIDTSDNGEKVDSSELKQIYNPKAVLIEKSLENMFEEFGYLTNGNDARGVFSQLYKIKQASDLLKYYVEKNNVRYDLVLKYRFDLDVIPLKDDLDYRTLHICDENFDLIYEPIDFSKFEPEYFYSEFDGTRYYDSKTNSYTDYPNWLHDKSFVCSYDNYLIFASLFDSLTEMMIKNGTSTTEHIIYDWVVNVNNMKVRKTYKLFCNCINKKNKFIFKY